MKNVLDDDEDSSDSDASYTKEYKPYKRYASIERKNNLQMKR